MQFRILIVLISLAALLNDVAIVDSAEKEWGTLRGQVILDGPIPQLKPLVTKGDARVKDPNVCAAQDIPDEKFVINEDSNGMANVFVYLQKRPLVVHPDLEKHKHPKEGEKADPKLVEVNLDVKKCQFAPHALFVQTGQQIRIFNRDSVAHNFHTFPVRNNPVNVILKPNDRVGTLLPVVAFPERLPCKCACDIHSWMNTWCLALDHPYCAITDESGDYEIPDLPVGKHEFIVWHESSGYVEKKLNVTIKKGVNEQEPFIVAIE